MGEGPGGIEGKKMRDGNNSRLVPPGFIILVKRDEDDGESFV